MPITGNCKLCLKEEELQESHILPSFVYKWLKETSATGYLRFGQAPNKRVQDGYKEYWLCRQCEQRLNVWETQFAKHVFHPINEDGNVRVPYGDWLLKFCASLSWRTLLMMKEKDHLDNFSDAQHESVNHALGRPGREVLPPCDTTCKWRAKPPSIFTAENGARRDRSKSGNDEVNAGGAI